MNYEYMALFTLSVLASFLLNSKLRGDVEWLRVRVSMIEGKQREIDVGSRVRIINANTRYRVTSLNGDICDLRGDDGAPDVLSGIPTCVLELA